MLGSENNENRNCGCMQNNIPNCECMGSNLENCDCDYTPQGINAAFGYNTANLNEEDTNCCYACNKTQCCDDRNAVRKEMLG